MKTQGLSESVLMGEKSNSEASVNLISSAQSATEALEDKSTDGLKIEKTSFWNNVKAVLGHLSRIPLNFSSLFSWFYKNYDSLDDFANRESRKLTDKILQVLAKIKGFVSGQTNLSEANKVLVRNKVSSLFRKLVNLKNIKKIYNIITQLRKDGFKETFNGQKKSLIPSINTIIRKLYLLVIFLLDGVSISFSISKLDVKISIKDFNYTVILELHNTGFIYLRGPKNFTLIISDKEITDKKTFNDLNGIKIDITLFERNINFHLNLEQIHFITKISYMLYFDFFKPTLEIIRLKRN